VTGGYRPGRRGDLADFADGTPTLIGWTPDLRRDRRETRHHRAQRAGQIYKKALAERVDLSVDEHRAEQSELIARPEGIRELRAIANGPKAGLRYKIDSWLAIVRYLERAAKLHGTDAPMRTEIMTISSIDQQIAELEAELERESQ
jgi:hypothetical protein